MNYTIKDWIITEHWQGAMIEDTNGNIFLTSGVYKWKLEPHMKFKIVDKINDESFYKYRNEYFPYCTLSKTNTVKCTYSNGDTITTSINGTLEEAKKYFLGNWFNFGDTDEKPYDDMQRCIEVEEIR